MGRKATPHIVQASCVYKWWRLPPCFWKFSSSSSGGTSRELHQYHKDANHRQYPVPPPPRHIPHWYLFEDLRFPLHSQSRNPYFPRDPQKYLSARPLAAIFTGKPKHNPHEQARNFSDQGNTPGKSSQPQIAADSF
ncbi:hypothetical protein QR685DRAFT_570550 [Neurospora intermedia]|uniref:Uncharacterized protein n=1 Tax=Neurospora intermedia TaxID=5142 RepID=A0ABR3DGK6_NEUIN